MSKPILPSYQCNAPKSRKVKCLNTGKVFESVSLAAAFAGCSQGAMSTAAIRDKEIKGLRFEYC